MSADTVLVVAVAAALCVGVALGWLMGREERHELVQDIEAHQTLVKFVLRVNEELVRSQPVPSALEAARQN